MNKQIKSIKMNKSKILLIPFLSALLFTSCLKDTPFMDVSSTQPIIEFANGTSGASSLGNFGMDPTADKLDTAIAVNIASPQVLDYPVTVTLKVDPSLLTKYNSVAGNTQLSMLPDSAYKYSTTTVTIQPGYRIARIPITLYPTRIDPSKSYGLPIAIVSATGPSGQNLLVSGNAGVAFYAFIGNPIAGAYKWDYTRWNNDNGSGTPHASSFTGGSTLFSVDNPTQVEVASGYVYNNRYVLSFDNNGGTLTNFKVSFNPDDIATMSAGGVTVVDGPNIIKADPINKEFIFQYKVYNGAAYRYFIDRYYK
jgi:hypothetical protein